MRIRTLAITGVEPIGLTEMKNYLKFTQSVTAEDTLISSLITSAREIIEKYTRSTIIKKSLEFYIEPDDLDNYEIELPEAPHISISSVKQEDYKGDLTILVLNTGYYLRGMDRKTIKFGNNAISLTGTIDTKYIVTALCGYDSNDILPNGVESDTFTNADLSSLILSIAHNLSTEDLVLTIKNPDGVIQFIPYTIVDADNITVEFAGEIGAGDWTWSLFYKASTVLDVVDNSTPEPLKEAIRQQVKIWYDNRGTDEKVLSTTVRMICNEYQQQSIIG